MNAGRRRARSSAGAGSARGRAPAPPGARGASRGSSARRSRRRCAGSGRGRRRTSCGWSNTSSSRLADGYDSSTASPAGIVDAVHDRVLGRGAHELLHRRHPPEHLLHRGRDRVRGRRGAVAAGRDARAAPRSPPAIAELVGVVARGGDEDVVARPPPACRWVRRRSRRSRSPTRDRRSGWPDATR